MVLHVKMYHHHHRHQKLVLLAQTENHVVSHTMKKILKSTVFHPERSLEPTHRHVRVAALTLSLVRIANMIQDQNNVNIPMVNLRIMDHAIASRVHVILLCVQQEHLSVVPLTSTPILVSHPVYIARHRHVVVVVGMVRHAITGLGLAL
jgi:hypothetical protein